MHQIDIEPSLLPAILDSEKTIEICLGTPQHLKLRTGDVVSVAGAGAVFVKITQLLYFETLAEALGTVDFESVIPGAKTPDEALAIYHQRYSEADETEYGAMAITFKLDD